MELWSALFLGLVGSLHCAGMCGPLVLAVSAAGGGSRPVASKLAYNAGRLATYALLGGVFGLIGRGLALAGMQRWLSILAGTLILIGLVASSRFAVNTPLYQVVARMKTVFGKLLGHRSLGSLALLGGLNGLLPCGLVYAACAGAAATGSGAWGAAYLLAFGIGTVPMMLTIAFAGGRIGFGTRLRLQRLVPAGVAIVGVLLVVRGMALGIPYISPAADGVCTHCL
jgi:uncharacterized protein